MTKFNFIQGELTESRYYRNEKQAEKVPEDTRAEHLFAMLLALQVLHYESPEAAQSYARKTLIYDDFDYVRPAATDLHNLISMFLNPEKYNLPERTIPEMQLRRYLRHVRSGHHNASDERMILYKMFKALEIKNPQLMQSRRAIQDWARASEQAKKSSLEVLYRYFKTRFQRADILSYFGKGKSNVLAKILAYGAAGVVGYQLGKALGSRLAK